MLDSSTKSNSSHKPHGMTANLSLKCGDSELSHPSFITAECHRSHKHSKPLGILLLRKGWFPRAADFMGGPELKSQCCPSSWTGCSSAWGISQLGQDAEFSVITSCRAPWAGITLHSPSGYPWASCLCWVAVYSSWIEVWHLPPWRGFL